jgi:hypothetical protein
VEVEGKTKKRRVMGEKGGTEKEGKSLGAGVEREWEWEWE